MAGGDGLGMTFMLESIGKWSEVTMTEELMIGFRVELTCVMRRSRVWPCLCVGMCICYKIGAIEKVGKLDGL